MNDHPFGGADQEDFAAAKRRRRERELLSMVSGLEAELARLTPVVEAAVAWRERLFETNDNGVGFTGWAHQVRERGIEERDENEELSTALWMAIDVHPDDQLIAAVDALTTPQPEEGGK